MKTPIFFLLAILLFSFSACDQKGPDQINDEVQLKLPLSDGSYTGTFAVSYTPGDTIRETVALEFAGGQFSGTATVDYMPGIGHGTLEAGSESIHFVNTDVWPAHFDWGLILDGDYTYTFNGAQLKFYKSFGEGAYQEYDLVKQPL